MAVTSDTVIVMKNEQDWEVVRVTVAQLNDLLLGLAQIGDQFPEEAGRCGERMGSAAIGLVNLIRFGVRMPDGYEADSGISFQNW